MLPIIYDTWKQGGIILIPIVLVGFWGFYLVLSTYFNLGDGLWKSDLNPIFDRIEKLIAQGKISEAKTLAQTTPKLVGYGLSLTLDHSHLPETELRRLLSEKMSFSLYDLERHLPLVRVMAGAAPLLGLLGTVSGLIHTFKVMMEYGNGNPNLLSQGISEALIATQSGLLLAIVLILLGQRLEGKVQWLRSQVEYGITAIMNQIYHSKEGGA